MPESGGRWRHGHTVEYFLASRMNQTGRLFRVEILLFLLGCGMVCILRLPDRNQNVA